jgi:hypothetical protein
MATSRTALVPDPLYRTLVWLDLRVAVLFAVGVPLVLLLWAAWRRERALMRLLGIYWKIASLLLITNLLLSDRDPLGFVIAVIAQLLVVVSLWFWVDLNEELADLPPWRPLPLTVRIWRWALSFWGVSGALLSVTALRCLDSAQVTSGSCEVWLQAPLALHKQLAIVFDFLFGGGWTPGVAAFIGYVGLLAYAVGLLQWLFVRLPKLGRVAGDF